MVVSVALWSIALKPSEASTIVPQGDLKITQVALGDELADASARNSIKITYLNRENLEDDDDDDDEEDEKSQAQNKKEAMTTTVLCSLTAGKIEQVPVDVVLDGDAEFIIENVGKNTVYLTGNYIEQMPRYHDRFDDDSDDEPEFDLRDVISDVEDMDDGMDFDLDTDGGRFEEINESEIEKKSLKRPRESEVSEKDGKAQAQPKLSKAEKKKLKKLKDESGAAVAVGGEAQNKQKKVAEPKKEEKEKKKDGESKPVQPKAAAQELSGGVKIVDSKKGTGPQAKKGNTVSMRYIGKLQNGNVFDSNTKGKPFTFHLGDGEVIKGWDVGIVGMQVGGERLLTIPPAMGYGKRKQQGIPPDSTLIFEVKLVEIK